LLKQELNGLHVVDQSHTKRSILVTSHYANEQVQKQAAKTNTKILPKQLASEIPIKINTNKQESQNDEKTIDLVIVDDNQAFANALIMFAFDDKRVDTYQDPHKFLENISKYPKNTKIF